MGRYFNDLSHHSHQLDAMIECTCPALILSTPFVRLNDTNRLAYARQQRTGKTSRLRIDFRF